MTDSTAIFIKTYAKDAEFLKYSLHSIVKFARGFDEIVVVSDMGEPRPPIGTIERHFMVKADPNGYAFQQQCKLSADAFTTCDKIVYFDSDTLFTKTVNASDLLENGKPIWLYEPYEGMTNPDVLKRKEHIEKFVGLPVEHEFMRRHPFIITRQLLVDLRRFCWRQHGVPMERYIMEMEHPSEFNILGSWLWHHRRGEIAWKAPQDVPLFVRQFWSHEGLKPESRTEMETILK